MKKPYGLITLASPPLNVYYLECLYLFCPFSVKSVVLRAMKKIFVSVNLPEVESLENIMEQSEIPCTIKNQQLAGLAGEVPFVEVFPELWVLRDEDLLKAKDILANWPKAKSLQEKEWICPSCGETIEKEFTACWNCSSDQTPEQQK